MFKFTQLSLVAFFSALILSSCQSKVPTEIIKDLPYYQYEVQGQSKSLLVDLYLPKTPSNKPFPVLLFIHGGGWYEGDKSVCPGTLVTQSGYAMACISYRFSSEAIFPAQIHDVKEAVRWLKKNAQQYNLNPDKIGAWGYSAGGHLSILLGTSGGVSDLEGKASDISSEIQAVCTWFAPTDFNQVTPAFNEEITPELLQKSRSKPWYLYTLATHRLLGSPVSQKPELTQLANPINYIDASDPPVLIMHGELDKVVPMDQSELLYDALKEKGVPVTFMRLPDRGHSFAGKNGELYDPKLIEMTLNFFEQYLH